MLVEVTSDLVVRVPEESPGRRNSTDVFQLQLDDHARGVDVGVVEHILPVAPVVHVADWPTRRGKCSRSDVPGKVHRRWKKSEKAEQELVR